MINRNLRVSNTAEIKCIFAWEWPKMVPICRIYVPSNAYTNHDTITLQLFYCCGTFSARKRKYVFIDFICVPLWALSWLLCVGWLSLILCDIENHCATGNAKRTQNKWISRATFWLKRHAEIFRCVAVIESGAEGWMDTYNATSMPWVCTMRSWSTSTPPRGARRISIFHCHCVLTRGCLLFDQGEVKSESQLFSRWLNNMKMANDYMILVRWFRSSVHCVVAWMQWNTRG